MVRLLWRHTVLLFSVMASRALVCSRGRVVLSGKLLGGSRHFRGISRRRSKAFAATRQVNTKGFEVFFFRLFKIIMTRALNDLTILSLLLFSSR
jgi:hypothetical protein